MTSHDHLDHLRRHFATELGARAVDYLSPNCPRGTADQRAVLACAALRAVGVANVPAVEGDWLAAGRALIAAELHGLTCGSPRIITESQEAGVRRQLATTLTPHGLLRLLAQTWVAGRRAERAAAAARLDGLPWPVETSQHQQLRAA